MTKITNTRGIAKCVAVIAIMAFAMVALCACGHKEITVNVLDEGKSTEVGAHAGETVGDILSAAGIAVNEGDEVSPSLDSEIGDGDVTITVERMKHVVVAVDGENIDVAMVNGTVQDALDSAGVTLKDGDKVDVDTAAPLEDGMLITVTRYVKKPEPAASNNTSSRNSGSSSNKSSEKSIVSRTQVPNCSGDGHGYYEITWSDGSMTYEEY